MLPYTKFKVGDLVVEKNTTKSPRKISRISPDPKHTFVIIFYDGNGCTFNELNAKYRLFVPKPNPAEPVKFKVVDNGVKVTLKSSAKCYLTVDGVDIPMVSDFFDTIDNLSGCDGYMSAMIFDNGELENALFSSGLMDKNARGGCFPTARFHELYDSIWEEGEKIYKLNPKMRWTPTKENIKNLPKPIHNYVESLQAEKDNLASALTEAIRFIKYSGDNECGKGMSWDERVKATELWENILKNGK